MKGQFLGVAHVSGLASIPAQVDSRLFTLICDVADEQLKTILMIARYTGLALADAANLHCWQYSAVSQRLYIPNIDTILQFSIGPMLARQLSRKVPRQTEPLFPMYYALSACELGKRFQALIIAVSKDVSVTPSDLYFTL